MKTPKTLSEQLIELQSDVVPLSMGIAKILSNIVPNDAEVTMPSGRRYLCNPDGYWCVMAVRDAEYGDYVSEIDLEERSSSMTHHLDFLEDIRDGLLDKLYDKIGADIETLTRLQSDVQLAAESHGVE